MKIDGRTRSKSEKEMIRHMAVKRHSEGESISRIASSYGVHRCTVHVWVKRHAAGGDDAIKAKPHSGRARTLTPSEEQEVYRWIVGGDPRQLGLDFGLWTRKIIQGLIEDRMGAVLSLSAVGNLLHRLGLSPQKPLRRAYERDDEAIQEWREKTYPVIKKKAKRRCADIFWLDEAGVRSDDPLQRTWGLIGKTPIVRTSGQRQSLNVITAVCNNGGFWYMAYSGRFNSDKFIECIRDFIKYRRRPAVLIMDGHPVHKSEKVRKFIKSLKGKVTIEILPPYAPECNPDEYVFHYMKKQGVTKKPLKKGESLKSRVLHDLRSIKADKKLVKSFFNAADVAFAAA